MGIITKYKNLGLKSVGLLAIALFLFIFLKGIIWYTIGVLIVGIVLGINIQWLGDKSEKIIEDKTKEL